MIRVGINGFGRIGRAIFRINEENPLFKVVAINDIDSNIDNHAYLLKYDTVYGRFYGDVYLINDKMQIVVNDNPIKFYSYENVNDVCWESHDLDIIIDASGIKNNVLLCNELIRTKKAKKVIVTFSPDDGIDHTIIFGVNEKTYNPESHHIVSTSICDSNASGPILKHLDDEFGIDHGFITTLHPWLSYQNLLDGSLRSVESPGHFWSDFSLGRASTESLIPKQTSLVSALKKVMKNVSNNLEAISFRTPTAIVASSDLTIRLNKSTNTSDLNDFFKQKSEEFNSIMGYQDDQLVSIDFKKIRESMFVDGRWTRVLRGNTIKLILWYDNEWGYSNRVYDMVKLMGEYIEN